MLALTSGPMSHFTALGAKLPEFFMFFCLQMVPKDFMFVIIERRVLV